MAVKTSRPPIALFVPDRDHVAWNCFERKRYDFAISTAGKSSVLTISQSGSDAAHDWEGTRICELFRTERVRRGGGDDEQLPPLSPF